MGGLSGPYIKPDGLYKLLGDWDDDKTRYALCTVVIQLIRVRTCFLHKQFYGKNFSQAVLSVTSFSLLLQRESGYGWSSHGGSSQ